MTYGQVTVAALMRFLSECIQQQLVVVQPEFEMHRALCKVAS
jgi:hypothetical protein